MDMEEDSLIHDHILTEISAGKYLLLSRKKFSKFLKKKKREPPPSKNLNKLKFIH